ncbi:MAG: hypothetical protein GQ537_06380 [Gammaproteobacteria bacterium]|nr:hypothetical protein [Gammaproteobacteria bacterium]
MTTGFRKYAYMTSVLAIVCFFLFPEPNIAVIGALLLQTLAYIMIAGRSTADGIILSGVTVLLIGSIPADHPMIRGPYFNDIKPWIFVTGIVVVVLGLLLVVRQARRG